MTYIFPNLNLNLIKLSFQFFPSHLVDRSIWPLMVSSSLFALVIGTVQYFHGYSTGFLLFKAALLITLLGASYWWKDVIIEASFDGSHTKRVQIGIAEGFNLFILSEVMAFFSVFWAYLHSSLSPAIEIGSTWPPVGITPLNAWAIPFINTLILVSSGGFITYAHHALIANRRKDAISGLFVTLSLALIFTFLQYIEYNQASFNITDSVFGSAFYATTGLHGAHVIIGTIFIVVQYIRITNYHLTFQHHLGLELSILYWHFVDVVWLFLFSLVYYWAGTGAIANISTEISGILELNNLESSLIFMLPLTTKFKYSLLDLFNSILNKVYILKTFIVSILFYLSLIFFLSLLILVTILITGDPYTIFNNLLNNLFIFWYLIGFIMLFFLFTICGICFIIMNLYSFIKYSIIMKIFIFIYSIIIIIWPLLLGLLFLTLLFILTIVGFYLSFKYNTKTFSDFVTALIVEKMALSITLYQNLGWLMIGGRILYLIAGTIFVGDFNDLDLYSYPTGAVNAKPIDGKTFGETLQGLGTEAKAYQKDPSTYAGKEATYDASTEYDINRATDINPVTNCPYGVEKDELYVTYESKAGVGNLTRVTSTRSGNEQP